MIQGLLKAKKIILDTQADLHKQDLPVTKAWVLDSLTQLLIKKIDEEINKEGEELANDILSNEHPNICPEKTLPQWKCGKPENCRKTPEQYRECWDLVRLTR